MIYKSARTRITEVERNLEGLKLEYKRAIGQLLNYLERQPVETQQAFWRAYGHLYEPDSKLDPVLCGHQSYTPEDEKITLVFVEEHKHIFDDLKRLESLGAPEITE